MDTLEYQNAWVVKVHPYKVTKMIFFVLFEALTFLSFALVAWIFLGGLKLDTWSHIAGVQLFASLFVMVAADRFERHAKKASDYYTKELVRLALTLKGKETLIFQGRKLCKIFVQPVPEREKYIWDYVSGSEYHPGMDDPD